MKKSLVFVLIAICYIAISLSPLMKNEKLQSVIHYDDYIKLECDISDVVQFNGCRITEQNELEIVGQDAFLVIEIPLTQVEFITVDVMENYSGAYIIYYAIDAMFSEVQTLTSMKGWSNIFFLDEAVNTIRVDLENVSVGNKFNLKNDANVIINGDMQEFVSDIWQAIYIYLGFLVISIIYILFLFLRRKYIGLGVAAIFCIIVSRIWLACVTAQMGMFVNIMILLVACLGMFFWGNCMLVEEEKWIKK